MRMESIFKCVPVSALMAALAMTTGLYSTVSRADDDFLSLLGGEEAKQEVNAPKKKSAAKPGVFRKIVTSEAGPLNAEQNIFTQFIDQGETEKALYQWSSAFEGTAFAKSATGRALKALLLFQNGVQVYALESLLSIDAPNKVSPALMEIWNKVAPSTHPAWAFVNTNLWKPSWNDILGADTEIRVLGRATYGPDQQKFVQELIKRAPEGTRERAWLEWQLVLATATGTGTQDAAGAAASAAKSLAILMKSPANPVSQDLMTLTAARMLYQNGFLDAAVKYYEKVPKASEDWFDAQEEMGWAYIRKGEPQNTIAITKTLAQPLFAAQVGPEAIFLRSLALLKVCDYPEVSNSLNLFRDRYKARAKEMMALAENSDTPAVQKFIQRAKTARVKLTDLGGDASKLPRFLTRDENVNQYVQTQAALEKESQKFGELYARSLSGGTAKVGFQAELEELKKSVDSRVQASRSATLGRVKTLAEEEVNEIAQVLQKLHIVEAEVIQQVSLADRVSDATSKSKVSDKKGTTGFNGPDRITFPAESEVWFDELANYQVDLKKGCQAVKR